MKTPGARSLTFTTTLLLGTVCAWLVLADPAVRELPAAIDAAVAHPQASATGESSVAGQLESRGAASERRQLPPRAERTAVLEELEHAAPAGPTVDLHGRVRERDGGAVAGALVEAWIGGQAGSGTGAIASDAAPPRATTDAEGRFALEALPRGAAGDLCVLAPDGRRVMRPLVATEEAHTLEVLLGEGRACAVRLIDGEGQRPLADLPVRLHGALERRTDATGLLAWTLPLDAARAVELALADATLRLAGAELGTPEHPTPVRVPAETLLAGRVLAQDGTPLEGASLWALAVSHSEDREAAYARLECRARATSDAAGRFALRLRAAPSARLRLVVERPGMLAYVAQDAVPLPCRDPLELRLRPAAAIHGRLAGPDPPPEALEWEGPLGPGHGGRVRPEADGSFRIEGLEQGEQRLLAVWGGAREELARVVLAAGERRALTLAYGAPRLASISGFVTLADGRPAAGAALRASARGFAGEPLASVAQADDEGRFALSVAPLSGLAFALEARLGEASACAQGVPGGTRGLALRLAAPPRLRLVVRDAATLGAPAGGVELAWRADPRAPFVPLHGDPRRRFGLDGRIDEPLEEPPAELRVRAQGYEPVVLAAAQLAAAIDARAERALELALEPGVSLRLRFTLDEAGAPPRLPLALGAGRVRLVPEGSAAGGERALRADREGTVRIDGLAPGLYRLVAEGCALRFSPAAIEVESEGLTEATVAVLDGRPQPGS